MSKSVRTLFYFMRLMGLSLVALLIFRVDSGSFKERTSRSPASLHDLDMSDKISQLYSQPLAHTKPISKPTGIADISIKNLGGQNIEEGSVLHLEADIQVRRNLDDVRYIWLLPEEGVEVLNGSLEGALGDISERDQIRLQLSLRKTTSENQRIHLHVYKTENGERIGVMTQYNTVNQPRMNREVKIKAESLQEMHKAGAMPPKILQ